MPEDQLDEFDRSNELIEESRTKLRAAHLQAAGKADVQAKIEQDLQDLTLVQEQLELDNLLGVAQALNGLSDLLDKAITEIKQNVDNFLLEDFAKLKAKVAALLAGTHNAGDVQDT
jgi:hypothetical protein